MKRMPVMALVTELQILRRNSLSEPGVLGDLSGLKDSASRGATVTGFVKNLVTPLIVRS